MFCNVSHYTVMHCNLRSPWSFKSDTGALKMMTDLRNDLQDLKNDTITVVVL